MNSTVGALGKASVQRTRFGTARQDTAVLQMGGAGVAQHAVSSTKHSTATPLSSFHSLSSQRVHLPQPGRGAPDVQARGKPVLWLCSTLTYQLSCKLSVEPNS